MTGAAVPLFDPGRQAAVLQDELAAAALRVLSSGRYILGPEVEAFERETAGYLGAAHAVGVGSGTDALLLSLKALGIGPGDRVLTTAFTFFATASAIIAAGAEPVFADIDPATYNLDPGEAAEVLLGRSPTGRRLGIDPATIRAVIPVHLYGQPAEMDELLALARSRSLFVVEDAAQAIGATYRGRMVGGHGDLVCFSFFPTKNLGGAGDGGLVTSGDASLAERLRMLRAHGAPTPHVHRLIGTNSRLDELQAAILRVKLCHLDEWISARRRHAATYDGLLEGLEGVHAPYAPSHCGHTYQLYTVRLDLRRDALCEALGARGVESRVYYPLPVHLQPALEQLGYRRGDFPHAEEAAAKVLSLPVFPELRSEEVAHVAAALRDALGGW